MPSKRMQPEAYAKKGSLKKEAKIWARHRSTLYLWTERHIETAVDYVMNRQGEDLPKFDSMPNAQARADAWATDTR